MGDPFISVIIIAYNRKEFLLDAIKSALDQTLDREYYEIIVIKNFQDDTIDNFIKENNIKGIISENKSLGGKISEALYVSKGEIVSFLEDDDMFDRQKLETVYKIFRRNTNVVYYHNVAEYIDESGKKLGRTNRGLSFNSSSISIRKSVVMHEFLENSKVSVDNMMFYFALESSGKIINGKKVLTLYRYHTSSSHTFAPYRVRLEQTISSYSIDVIHFTELYNYFSKKGTRRAIFNHIMEVSIIANIASRLLGKNQPYRISFSQFLRWMSILYYWDSPIAYPLKYIRVFELFGPVPIVYKVQKYLMRDSIKEDNE
ncbi:hypothetical protein [Thermoplasma volcanium GSS1]|uniref:Glycosyltransferase 2-like domain-containing protein n=1 Tax=Thermoplasma volcanium (strain ATCC 51530 / DSM 4299 / JCM 9571 / NBRC 15438 / GSS1) TaxID=273116 RepID=Q97AD4_THEVO|nr:glycosyltransferase family 2 protein [Thermoplasma volcanium]BAB60018.1 hypothetical protein [Thermoplasma volcanium GSS1]